MDDLDALLNDLQATPLPTGGNHSGADPAPAAAVMDVGTKKASVPEEKKSIRVSSNLNELDMLMSDLDSFPSQTTKTASDAHNALDSLMRDLDVEDSTKSGSAQLKHPDRATMQVSGMSELNALLGELESHGTSDLNGSFAISRQASVDDSSPNRISREASEVLLAATGGEENANASSAPQLSSDDGGYFIIDNNREHAALSSDAPKKLSPGDVIGGVANGYDETTQAEHGSSDEAAPVGVQVTTHANASVKTTEAPPVVTKPVVCVEQHKPAQVFQAVAAPQPVVAIAPLDSLDALMDDLDKGHVGTAPVMPPPVQPSSSPPKPKQPHVTLTDLDRAMSELNMVNPPKNPRIGCSAPPPPPPTTVAVVGPTCPVVVAARAPPNVANFPPIRAAADVPGRMKAPAVLERLRHTLPGICVGCQKPCDDENGMSLLDKVWHRDCFNCMRCDKSLIALRYYEKDELPYCEPCYRHEFSPKCAYCHQSSVEKCVHAAGRTWHVEHFFCSQCGKTFDNGKFMEKDGKCYCEEDYYTMFAPKCEGCGKPVMAECISALGGRWHPDCFVCYECRVPFAGGSFFEVDGLPYCEKHHFRKSGMACGTCGKVVVGRCVNALGKRYHPDCFSCTYCKRSLDRNTFTAHEDRPYCHTCNIKLFG